MQAIQLTRRELYDLIWSEPLMSLTRRYNLSDSGFRKLCKSHDIPVPTVAHWRKLKMGKPTKVEDFVEKQGESDNKIILHFRDENSAENQLVKKIQNFIRDESFKVPAHLLNPDLLIVEADRKLKRGYKTSKTQNVLSSAYPGLMITVTQAVKKRALLFMDTLIKILKNRGHDVVIENETKVVIGNEKIKISLLELRTMCRSQNDKWPQVTFVPNGKLCFKIDDVLYARSWQDRKAPLEDHLPSIVATLEMVAQQMHSRVTDIERQQPENAAQQIEPGTRTCEEIELEKFKELLFKAVRWQQVNIMRQYVLDRVDFNPQNNNELAEWREWAMKKIDWFDPSVNGEDDLLRNVNKDTLEFRNDSSKIE